MTATAQDFVTQQPILNKRRRILRPMLEAVGNMLCKIEATGLERIPENGPAILMMNHISFIDPIVLTAIVRKRFVISMAKAEALDNWFYRQMVWLWGNFVVRRGEVDRDALKTAVDLLNNSELVLIAPEGTRNPQGMQRANSGIAYLAHKTNAVIIPVAICGAQTWGNRLKRLRRAYARVNIGQPFRLCLPDGERFSTFCARTNDVRGDVSAWTCHP